MSLRKSAFGFVICVFFEGQTGGRDSPTIFGTLQPIIFCFFSHNSRRDPLFLSQKMFKKCKTSKTNIVFIGPPGSGKSSLINRMLCKRVIPTGDGEEGATYCPIEVHHDRQTTNYIVTMVDDNVLHSVEFQDVKDVRAYIQALSGVKKTSNFKIMIKGCFGNWNNPIVLIDTPSDTNYKERNSKLLVQADMMVFVHKLVKVSKSETVAEIADIISDCYPGFRYRIVATRARFAMESIMEDKVTTDVDAVKKIKDGVKNDFMTSHRSYTSSCMTTHIALEDALFYVVDNEWGKSDGLDNEFKSFKESACFGGA